MPECSARFAPRNSEYVPLVRDAAHRLQRRLAGSKVFIPFDDLLGAGLWGLQDALQRFQPQLGEFEVFARKRIRGAMIDELRRRDHLSRYSRENLKRVAQARERLRADSGYEPEDEAVESAARLTARQRLALERLPDEISLSELMEQTGSVLADSADHPEQQAYTAQVLERLFAACDCLSPRERVIIQAHYGHGFGLRQIGLHLHMSKTLVAQLHRQAIDKLEWLLRARGVDGWRL